MVQKIEEIDQFILNRGVIVSRENRGTNFGDEIGQFTLNKGKIVSKKNHGTIIRKRLDSLI